MTKDPDNILEDPSGRASAGSPSQVTTYSVVIPALNEEQNIGHLLEDIMAQRLGNSLELDKVIVVSDCSTDNTNQVVDEWAARDGRVELLVNSTTAGQAESIANGLHRASSDFVVLLDGDIRMNGPDTMLRLLGDIDTDVGMIGGNPVPAAGERNLPARLSECGDFLRNALKMRLNEGNNIYSAYGRIIALSRELYQTTELPRNPDSAQPLVPADQFLYLTCLTREMRFVLRNDAEVFYNLPASLRDYLRQGTRFVFAMSNTRSFFDEALADREYNIPLRVKVEGLADTFVHHDKLITVLWVLFHIYGRLELWVRRHILKEGVGAAWELCESTKSGIGDS